VSISEDSAMQLSGASGALSLSLTSGDAITNAADMNLVVTNNTTLNGTSISLGTVGGDVFNTGTLTFSSGGTVSIAEDSAMVLTGTNAANALVLNATGAITDAPNTSLNVTGNADFTANNGAAQAITLGDNAL